jgi:LysR family glycine cleavage system transcriptional activator
MFAETDFDAALFAGTAAQMTQWAGTRVVRLMPEVVVPVCAPALLQGASSLDAAALAALPLLQQSTRPNAWREWFEAAGVSDSIASPVAMAGPRFEQFSMTAAAAVAGLGLALVPSLLVEAELARGELVLAHPSALAQERHYYVVLPGEKDLRPVAQLFVDWLGQASKSTASAP